MTKIVGILNITPDSFSDGGEYNTTALALEGVRKLFDEGADFVDIGAQSTTYDAKIISPQDEWLKLAPVIESIIVDKDLDIKKISVDTFNVENIKKAIKLGVGIINDVKGGRDKEVLKLIADNPDVKYIAMYSKTIPAKKDVRASNFIEIMDWISWMIECCSDYGIGQDQLIIDPGIGFSTSPGLSFEVISSIDVLKDFGYPVMIGHSRKSFFTRITDVPPKDRDIETLTASIHMYHQGVDYLRVHNVKFHKNCFTTLPMFKNPLL